MAINKNDYLDGDGNYDLKKALVDELIGGIDTNTANIDTNTANIDTNTANIASIAQNVTAGSLTDPLVEYKAMKDGSHHIGWQWSATSQSNWPVTTSGYNLILLARGNSDYGFAIAIMANSKTYTATLRDALSTITWTALN